MSFLEIDFNPKLVDVVKMKRYIAKRLLGTSPKVKLDPNTFALAPTNDGSDNWIDWIGDNQRAIDPQALEKKIREEQGDLLLEDERLIMAFKSGRDIVLFTNARVSSFRRDVLVWSTNWPHGSFLSECGRFLTTTSGV